MDADRDVKFRMQIFDQNIYDMIKKYFGEPVEDLLVQQYLYLGKEYSKEA